MWIPSKDEKRIENTKEPMKVINRNPVKCNDWESVDAILKIVEDGIKVIMVRDHCKDFRIGVVQQQKMTSKSIDFITNSTQRPIKQPIALQFPGLVLRVGLFQSYMGKSILQILYSKT